MVKYLAIVVGVIVLCFSIAAWIDFQPVNTRAESITISQACDLSAGRDLRYVTFPAELDTAHRVYRSGLAEPLFTPNDPDATCRIEPQTALDRAKMDSLLGCLVRVDAAIDPRGVGTMQVILDHDDDDESDELQSEKCLAPVLGSGNHLLALSPTFRDENHANRWIARGTFTGRLSRLADMKRNARGVTHDVAFIVSMMRGWGVDVPDHAYVILTEKDAAGGERRHLVPVSGADFRLFLDVTDDQEQRFIGAGCATGLLRSRDAADFAAAGRALGVPLPERIAILTDETAESYNTGARAVYTLGVLFGLFLVGTGGGAVWLKHHLKHRRRHRPHPAGMQQFQDNWRDAA